MPEHIVWFHLVFSSQILLLSFYLPRRVLGRLRYVVETYPPETYPKLYPVSMDALARTQRHYRNLNMFALMCGVALLLSGIYSGGDEQLSWDTQSVLGLYFFLKMSPGLLLTRAILSYYKLMRKANSRTTRKAELRPRRLLDFISPTIIGVAVATYVAFVVLVLYIRQDPFPGFAGYWNIAVMTAGNLCFAGFAFRNLYGKKVDPHQYVLEPVLAGARRVCRARISSRPCRFQCLQRGSARDVAPDRGENPASRIEASCVPCQRETSLVPAMALTVRASYG